MAELTHIEDGRAAVFKREGTYQARIRVDGKYVYRSLKTGDLEQAKKTAQKLLHKFEFSAENGIPISAKKFSVVIEDYVQFRERENEQGHTSDGMLRQIKRVVRFWHAYAGDKLISAIGDKELRDYVQWRRDYYTQRPNEAKKRNVKANPTRQDAAVRSNDWQGNHRVGQRARISGQVAPPNLHLHTEEEARKASLRER